MDIDKEVIKKIFESKEYFTDMYYQLNSKFFIILKEIGFIEQFFNESIEVDFIDDDYIFFVNDVNEDLIELFIDIDILSFTLCGGLTSVSIVGKRKVSMCTLNNNECIHYLSNQLGLDNKIFKLMKKLREVKC